MRADVRKDRRTWRERGAGGGASRRSPDRSRRHRWCLPQHQRMEFPSVLTRKQKGSGLPQLLYRSDIPILSAASDWQPDSKQPVILSLPCLHYWQRVTKSPLTVYWHATSSSPLNPTAPFRFYLFKSCFYYFNFRTCQHVVFSFASLEICPPRAANTPLGREIFAFWLTGADSSTPTIPTSDADDTHLRLKLQN